ncbi:hypothetical protein EOD23_04280 [Mesorhizobium sp. USDA-HM6]|nr:hypothetical protein EOD23_04280 [Mesorhizobium sp. USDA-HM6]
MRDEDGLFGPFLIDHGAGGIGDNVLISLHAVWPIDWVPTKVAWRREQRTRGKGTEPRQQMEWHLWVGQDHCDGKVRMVGIEPFVERRLDGNFWRYALVLADEANGNFPPNEAV